MSVSDIGKLCVFSQMSGVVTHDGKPVANARLVRSGEVAGSEKEDEAITDDTGRFHFPALYVRSITKYLPQEFVAKQSIQLHHEGKIRKIWHGVKRSPEENTEARGKPLDVACEISDEEQHLWVQGSTFVTLCKWDVEPDPPISWDEETVPDSAESGEEIEYFDPTKRNND